MSAPHAMVYLPGGDFSMGQTDGRDEERPVHPICVSPFSLATTQVTNAQYDLFCAATRRPRPQLRMEPSFDQPNQPVVAANWFHAVAYCEWLTSVTGTVFRLPTEAEWEWAARGGLAARGKGEVF